LNVWDILNSQLVTTLIASVLIPYTYSAIQNHLQQVKLEDLTFQKALMQVSKTLSLVNGYIERNLVPTLKSYKEKQFAYPLKIKFTGLDNIIPDNLACVLIDYLENNKISDRLFLKIDRTIMCRQNLKECILLFNSCVDEALVEYKTNEEIDLMHRQSEGIARSGKVERIHIYRPKLLFDQLLQLFFDYFKALTELLDLLSNERKYKQFMSFSPYHIVKYFKYFPTDRKIIDANLNELQQFLVEINAQ
jgi:hypothetical protein